MSTLAELTTPMTVAEARTAIYDSLAAQGVNVTLWKAGAPTRTLVAGLAILLAALSALQAQLARSGFLAYSAGSWLTLVAELVYGVERDPGGFATGILTIDNAGGGVYVLAVGDLVVSNGSKTYKNTEAVTVNALAVNVEVDIQATELGTDSSAGAATITTLVTPYPGLSVTNDAALVGYDEETDATLRARCAAKLGSLSPNGPKDAYNYVLTTTTRADETSIGVNRVRAIADGLGGIDVYVATPSGAVSGDVDDPETDLGVLSDAMHELAEPLAITSRLRTASLLTIAVTYALTVRDTVGKTNDEIAEAVEEALETYLAAAPIGGFSGFVHIEAIRAVIASAVGVEYLITYDVTLPAADVAVTSTQAPAVGVVTGTITQLPIGVL